MALAFSSDELLFLEEENIFWHALEYKASYAAQKETALGKTDHRNRLGHLGQGFLRSTELRVTWSKAPLSRMQQNRLERAPAWEPGDLASSSCLSLLWCTAVDEPLFWMHFPIHSVYILYYLNFDGLWSFMIQWVFEIKYLKTKKRDALEPNQKVTFMANPYSHKPQFTIGPKC